LVEHLENSSPLIVAEIHRWRGLLWDEWLDYQYWEKRGQGVGIPLRDTPSN